MTTPTYTTSSPLSSPLGTTWDEDYDDLLDLEDTDPDTMELMYSLSATRLANRIASRTSH